MIRINEKIKDIYIYIYVFRIYLLKRIGVRWLFMDHVTKTFKRKTKTGVARNIDFVSPFLAIYALIRKKKTVRNNNKEKS